MRVLLLAAGLALFALAALPAVVELAPIRPSPAWSWVPIMGCFLLAERATVRLTTSRSSHSVTMRDLPAVLGAVLLPPPVFIAVHVVGSLLPLALRRPPMPGAIAVTQDRLTGLVPPRQPDR